MRKIPTLYQRDPATKLRHVKADVHPDCRWVIDGEGTATYKWNGTAVKIDESGIPYKRREVKKDRPEPEGFIQEGGTDPNTGKRVGWVMIEPTSTDDKWHYEGLGWLISEQPETEPWPQNAAGTYELVGPKVQGNPHGFAEHRLIRHGGPVGEIPVDFDALGSWLHKVAAGGLIEDGDGAPYPTGFEGVVWHHPDGRMAKIKVRDFPSQT